MKISVSEIRGGDEFLYDGVRQWQALGPAEVIPDGVEVRVRYRDGGVGIRQWDDPRTPIEVAR